MNGQTLFGLDIVVSPLVTEVPRLQLSHSFNACSPEMKQKTNDWLLKKFGTYMPVYIISGGTVVINPKHYAMMKIATGTKE